MTAISKTRNEIELSGDELNLVVGGWGSYYWAPPTPTSTVNSTLLAAAEKLSAIQPIHLAPLPPLHSALTHDRPRILTCCDGEPPVPTGVYRVRMLAKGVDRVGK